MQSLNYLGMSTNINSSMSNECELSSLKPFEGKIKFITKLNSYRISKAYILSFKLNFVRNLNFLKDYFKINYFYYIGVCFLKKTNFGFLKYFRKTLDFCKQNII